MLISRGHHKVIIWYNPNKNIFYHKAVKGYYRNYVIGEKNQYKHQIVDIIDLEFYEFKYSLKKRLLRKLISFLEKIERK